MHKPIKEQWFVVDFADDFILTWGTLKEMKKFLDTTYGGCEIAAYENLTSKMKQSISLYTHGILLTEEEKNA